MSEKEIIQKVLLYFTENGHRIFRQNTGFGWVGAKFIKPAMETSIRVTPSDVVIKNARPLHAGLCKGSSDLIGWKSVTVTPEMVGKKIAIFTAVECKTKFYKTTEEQDRFLNAVNHSGGIGLVVRELEDLNGF